MLEARRGTRRHVGPPCESVQQLHSSNIGGGLVQLHPVVSLLPGAQLSPALTTRGAVRERPSAIRNTMPAALTLVTRGDQSGRKAAQ